ncbi:hypothetical protein VTN96DRAFT_7757 [Rasamsonia emersonii]|uniref:Early meiotic induction protein 1 n=1 Tax=Rasamsonia emersonii (strain ATCC 16479 / CBS 393.64 / IMI 116815) TaxID=1408163 RepID=A0A0F4YF77_RASE3|nr:hypothetical protein T310_9590 [Rasamsonia emersonii CBS 393.64]KKA16770.1 hypothetical protein T310_9590 [Rasamsonia emersonii CBS 393.64]
MGWWWSSTPRKDEQQSSAQPPSPAPLEEAGQPPQPSAVPPKPSKPITRDEQAEAEFKEFLAGLEGTAKPSSNAQPAEEAETKKPKDPPASIHPESLYPDTMDCRSAFDYAFFCQSFGGQFVNIYRYGELRSCSEHWKNFWFCMKSKAYPDEQRKEMIRDHYRKKAIKYKTGPSSEDVWEVRTEPVKNAFQGDFAALERRMKEEEEEVARRQQ